MNNKNVGFKCKHCSDMEKAEFKRLNGLVSLAQYYEIFPEDTFIKCAFTDGNEIEHMWVKVKEINYKSRIVNGTLENEPLYLKNISYKDKTIVLFDNIENFVAGNVSFFPLKPPQN